MKTQLLYTLTTALTVTLFPTATPKSAEPGADFQASGSAVEQNEIFKNIGGAGGSNSHMDFAWESGSLESARLMQSKAGSAAGSGFSTAASDPLAWEVVDSASGNEVSTGSIAELAQAATPDGGDATVTDGAAQTADKEVETAVEPAKPATPVKKEETVNLLNKSGSSISDLVGGAKLGAPTPAETLGATASAGDPMDPMEAIDGSAEDGFFIREAQLNDVFQFLAKAAGLNYFHNAELAAPSYIVTGHLQDGEPLQQMKELGLMYGITIYEKGTTVYAMTEGQLSQLPTKPFMYQLKYLRPGDIDQIRAILSPALTPGRGSVDYETKTNTLIMIDNEQRVEALKGILAELDKPKRQVAIEMRILRVTSGSRNRIGVDWSSVLGDQGIALGADSALNNLFNLPDLDSATEVITLATDQFGSAGIGTGGVIDNSGFNGPVTFTAAGVASTAIPSNAGNFTITGAPSPGNGNIVDSGVFDASQFNGQQRTSVNTRTINTTGSGLVLDSVALDAVMRALNQGNLAEQESSPTLITEDNEQGIISIIDRVPIIVATVNNNSAGSNVTERVRYRIDQDDPVDDPANTREIGVTMSITPTILPDNTIRMVMRPRTAQIVEFIIGQTGNRYPRVSESTVDTIARVPNGSSLLVGGFYEEAHRDQESKVPILGDIPWVNFFFKSTDKEKTITSIVFVVTPTAYDAESPQATMEMTKQLHDRQVLPFDHNWPDRKSPGYNHEANLGRTLGNALKLYPEVPAWNPLSAEHPINDEITEAAAAQQPPANHRKPRNPLIRIFGFGKN